jgi:hypothetical protein
MERGMINATLYYFSICIRFMVAHGLTSDFYWGFCCSIFSFLCNVLFIVICPFVIFGLAIVLSVLFHLWALCFLFGVFGIFLSRACLTCNFIKESHSEKAPLNGQVHVHIISISLAHSKTTMVLLQNHGLSVKIYIMIALIRRILQIYIQLNSIMPCHNLYIYKISHRFSDNGKLYLTIITNLQYFALIIYSSLYPNFSEMAIKMALLSF